MEVKDIKQTVESFVRSGNFRSVLEKDGELNEDEIDFLVDVVRISLSRENRLSSRLKV